ncbi:histidine kinase [Clostridiales bacterium PH28_bin88]|nr:histidine kinase [Clostridiales bacterium PH28_bin88]
MTLTSYRLEEAVDGLKLQEVQNKFSEATGLAAIIAERDGSAITRPSHFSRLCRMIRSTQLGREECYKSDAQVGIMAAETGKTSMHYCHSGLIDLAAPLMVNGACWGSILCGQVLLSKPGKEELGHAVWRAKKLGLNTEEYVDAFREIEVVPENRVRAAAELLQMVANYIVEMGVSRLFQQKLVEEIRTRAEMEQALRSLELKALQSQVNPHFLFNTLNAATRLALFENAPRTQELVHALARLLRYSLRNIDQMIPLREEIDHVRNYLLIQKVRYQDHIQISIEADEEILGFLIPAMTLQPLVENAIVHGLEPKEENGLLSIVAFADGEEMVVMIRDTGVGMENSLVNRVLNEGGSGFGHTTGLGIRNVNGRLQHYFGKQYGLSISSTVTEGTEVTVRLPRLSTSQTERV